MRDRIDRLLDPGAPFLEIVPLAAWGMYEDQAPGAPERHAVDHTVQDTICAPMPGHIRSVQVAEGDAVSKGQTFDNGRIMAGKYFEDFEVGAHFKHSQGRTVTETDNVLFCALTMNDQPLHINEDFASHTQFGRRIVNGIFTMGLVVGLSVGELSEGTIVANLGYDHVVHPNPVFHGDTIYVESEVLEMRESRSRPDCGIVRLKHTGRKQDGTVVVELERTTLFLKKGKA